MKYRKEVFRSLTLITQLGISVMVPLFLCILVGVTIDKYFGTSTTVWFMLIGMLAGGRNAYILAKSVLHQNVEESKKRKRP